MAKPTTTDAYMARLPAEQRAALEKVRKAIRAAAPQALECFSYGLPAFRDRGGLLAGFGASAKHCAYYPMSGSVVAAFESELEGYATSKGAIRFDAAKPLSAALVRKLVKARQGENAAKAAPKAAPKAVSAPRAARASKRLTEKAPPYTASRADPAVIAYLRELDHPLAKEIAAVRRIILSVSPEIGEGIKWNAPSFRTPREYFATFNVRSQESVQLILHLGAKVRAGREAPRIADPKGLLTWLAHDRCKVMLGKRGDIAKNRAALLAILRAWVEYV